MDLEKIKYELVQQSYISGVKVYKDKKINDVDYLYAIRCRVEVLGKYYPLQIGVPEEWAEELVDIYVDSEEPLYIPHINQSKKLCLYDLENSLIESDFLGVLTQCVDRARKLLIDGLSGENWDDFLTEFDSYIGCLPDCKKLKIIMPNNQVETIQYCGLLQASKVKKKNENYAEYLKRIEQMGYFASHDSNDFKTWGYKDSRKNGLFISIKSESNIYPPRFTEKYPFAIDYLNNLLSLIKPTKGILEFFRKVTTDKLVVFEIEQPSGIKNSFGVLIENGEFEINAFIKCITARKIIPLSLERLNENILLSRTSYGDNTLANKKYLLIGCGSVGGYIFENLIKSGCKDITLVDCDILKAENIYRHLLGIEYIGITKVHALKEYGEKNIPNLNVTPVFNKIQRVFEDNDIYLGDYDYIIAATGNENINQWINRYMHESDIVVPVIYVWNEPLDIGCHAAIIQKDKDGCYECFFELNNNCELSNRMSYCQPGQNFTKNTSGCNGSFIPYGSFLSIRSALICMELLINHNEGRIKENLLISEKGEDYYFYKAGFRASERYLLQKDKIQSLSGIEFKNEKCEFCGVKK